MNTKRYWSESELNILKKNYKFGIVKCAELLDRTYSSIRARANRLGLKVVRENIFYEVSELESAVKKSFSYTEVVRKLGKSVSGDQLNIVKKYIELYNIKTTHFKRVVRNSKALSEYLKKGTNIGSSKLKGKLYSKGLKQRVCEMCGQGEIWKGKKISLILDHINGINNDNRLENLRIVCPNCNAALPTHCRGSKGLLN